MKKILIFGAGVIGSVYAGKLALAGHRVSVLARNKRLKELEVNGLLLSENGKKTVKPNVTVISELKTDDVYDYIFVTLRKDQVSDALLLLSQNQSKNFVFMVNTASGYSDWIGQIGLERVIPAFPGTGGKVENGIVYFSLTSRFVQPTTLGEIDGKAPQRINELAEILRNAGFPTSISKKMDSWQKSHVAMVCPLAYGIYFDGGNNYTFSKNKPAIIQTNKALKETFSFLKNSGIGVEPLKLNMFRLTPLPILNWLLSIVFNTKWAETVISNHALAARDEMEMLFNDFILLAEDKGYNLNELKKIMDIDKTKNNSPLKFFLLVFGLSIPFWLLAAVAPDFTEILPIKLPISALMTFCPLIAAAILVYKERKFQGVWELLKLSFDFGKIKDKKWYLPIVFLMPFIALLSYGYLKLTGELLPEPATPLLYIFIFFFVFFIGAIGEEIGWSGYVTDPLQSRYGALKASIILGFVWAIWHIIPWSQAHQTPIWIFWQAIGTIFLRVIMVWIFNNTGKSIFAMILFHTMLNLSPFLIPNYGSHYDPFIFCILLIITAIAITFLRGTETRNDH